MQGARVEDQREPERPPRRPARAVARARRGLWLVLLFVLLAIGVGGAWDRSYHVTQPFDSFYSPPHLFIYTMFGVAALLTARLALRTDLRRCFGRGFRVPGIPFSVPGPLFILAGGVLTVLLAGALDDLWHSHFGLDETGWSFPHAMLGWGLLVLFLGVVASRLALRPQRPLSRPTPYVLGFFLLAFSVTPFLGPLYNNHTPETIQAVAAIPVLAAQPDAQHTFRIYLAWNLDRTNPLFPPLAALWAGTALALVRGLDGRPRVLLAVTALVSLSSTLTDRGAARFLDRFLEVSGDPATWLPLPVLPAAVAFLLVLRLTDRERTAWALAGLLFGVLIVLVWGRTPGAGLLALLAAPAALLGARLGEGIWPILERPDAWGAQRLVLVAGLGVPLLLGVIDLSLRAVTP